MGGTLHPIMRDFKTEIHCLANDCARMMLRELEVIENHLAGRQYLVGDSLTIADLLLVSFAGCGIQVLHGAWYEDYPNMARWLLPIWKLPEHLSTVGELKKLEANIPLPLKGKSSDAAKELLARNYFIPSMVMA